MVKTGRDLSVSRTVQHVLCEERRDSRNPDSFGTLEWQRNWPLVSHGSEGCASEDPSNRAAFSNLEQTGAQ